MSGIVYSVGREFSPAGAAGSENARICRASARVHFDVKSDSGSWACWLWMLGAGK